MASLGGHHVQARTGRELTWQCVYEIVGEADLAYVAVITEGRNYLGQHEATLRFDPAGIPANAIVRMNMVQHLDRTTFGEGVPPDPRWVGWYGPYL